MVHKQLMYPITAVPLSMLLFACGSPDHAGSPPQTGATDDPGSPEYAEVTVTLAELIEPDGSSQTNPTYARTASKATPQEEGSYTLTLFFNDCDSGAQVFQMQDSVPDWLTEFRFPGIQHQGTFCVGAELEMSDSSTYETQERLTYDDGSPIFPEAEPVSVTLTYGQVSPLELTLYAGGEDVALNVSLEKCLSFSLELTQEQKERVDATTNLSAEATLAGCTDSGQAETLPLTYDGDTGTFSWSDDDADFLVLANTGCTFAVSILESGVSFMAGTATFTATPYTTTQELGTLELYVIDAQLDVTLTLVDGRASLMIDISELAAYLDDSTWSVGLEYLLTVLAPEGSSQAIPLVRTEGTHLLTGEFSYEEGLNTLTLIVADGTTVIFNGSTIATLPEAESPTTGSLTIPMVYEYVAALRATNLENVYFRAYLEDAHDVTSGILVSVTGTVYAGSCTTGAGNDADDEVIDGDYTCLLRLPFESGASAGYTVVYSYPGYASQTGAVTVSSITSLSLPYVALQPESGDCASGGSYPSSCLEILSGNPSAQSGSYCIDVDGTGSDYPGILVSCDMETDGGGWTGITFPLADSALHGTMTAVHEVSDGIDPVYGPYTQDGSDYHSYHYTFSVPFQYNGGYREFYLEDYAVRANAAAGATADLSDSGFTMTRWDQAYGAGNAGNTGDIGFGTPDLEGPTVSYGDCLEIEPTEIGPDCTDCIIDWCGEDTRYAIDLPNTTPGFRVAWGDYGGESEGWYPWYQGTVYLR